MEIVQPLSQSFARRYPAVLRTALQTEGIRINRETYLRSVLSKYCFDDVVDLAIVTTPAHAGVLEVVINIIAENAIKEEADNIAKGSFITGLPGGIWGVAGVFGDMAQYFCFSLRLIQKLVYLYGGDEFFESGASDEEIEDRFTCFLCIMFGVKPEGNDFKRYAMYSLIPHIERQLLSQVLLKTLYSPIAKKVTRRMGIKITKRSFTKGISKTIPIGGAYISSKFARGYFVTKAEELQEFLKELEIESRTYYLNS